MATGSHFRLASLQEPKGKKTLAPTRCLKLLRDTYLISSFFSGSLGGRSDPELLWISLHVQPQQAQREQDGTGQAHEQGQPSMACDPAPLKLPSVTKFTYCRVDFHTKLLLAYNTA